MPYHQQQLTIAQSSPLAILDTRWVHIDFEPQLMVLVQWTCLSPDDTSWEDWASLRSAYNLEDKMFLDDIGNDRKRIIAQQGTTLARPKRKTIPPKHLVDYV